MTEYAAGQIAAAKYKGYDVRIACVAPCNAWLIIACESSRGVLGAWPDIDELDDIRPLVVLDLEGIGSPQNVVRTLRWTNMVPVEVMSAIADQIEAQTRPPKPAEPTGLGAVVKDSRDRVFVRIERDGGQAKWILINAPEDEDPRYVWSAIDAVKVLSEGVDTTKHI